MAERPISEKIAHFTYLLTEDDHALFGHGGCHVFALELNRRYGYPLMLMEKSDGRISHVYCLRHDTPFDIRAGQEPIRYFFECFEGTSRATTASEIESMFSGEYWDGVKYGLWGEPGFLEVARARAASCAQKQCYAP